MVHPTRPSSLLRAAVAFLVGTVLGVGGGAGMVHADPAPSSIAGTVYLGSTATPAGTGEVNVFYSQTIAGGAHGQVSTAADGSYLISGLPDGGYNLRFDYVGDAYVDEWYPHVYSLRMRTSVAAGSTVNATLAPAASISGRLVDKNGDPVPTSGTTVSAQGFLGFYQGGEEFGATYSVTPAPDGTFSLDGLYPGYYHLTIETQYFITPLDGTVLDIGDVAPGEAVDLSDITLWDRGGISGWVNCVGCIDNTLNHSPRDDMWASLEFRETSADPWEFLEKWPLYRWNGSFQFSRVIPRGEYRVTIDYVGIGTYSPTTHSSPFTVSDGQNVDLGSLYVDKHDDRDLSGDGAADILYRDSLGHLMLYVGNGTGGFAGKTQIGGTGWGGFTAVVTAGDFDGDGFGDVIARSSAGYLYLYRGNGARGFLSKSTISTSSFWKTQTVIISPGDFDGDGATDLISRDAYGYLWLHRGNGSGGIASKIKIGSSGWKAYTVLPAGDFNGDGAPDLMARDSSGVLWLYPGNGTGGFKPRVKLGTGWGTMTAIRGYGDFNGDGWSDVIARDASGYLWLYPGNASIGKFSGKIKIGSSGWKAFRLAS